MKYIKLGNSGTMVSQLALGTWHLPGSGTFGSDNVEEVDQEQFNKIVKKAYDYGINFYDTSNIYHGRVEKNEEHINRIGNSERVLGNALKGYDRETLVIATKVRGPVSTNANGEGLSRKHILWQIKESLKRLNMEYVDLYQTHWADINTPHLETARAMSHLVDLDIVRYIGESNNSADEIRDFMEISEKYNLNQFITMQQEYSLLHQLDNKKLEIAKKYGLGILAYAPLAQGILTGKYIKNEGKGSRSTYYPDLLRLTENNKDKIIKLLEFADEKGISGSQLALAWLIKKSEIEGISVIPLLGITKMEYLEQNLASLDIKLNSSDIAYLNKILN